MSVINELLKNIDSFGVANNFLNRKKKKILYIIWRYFDSFINYFRNNSIYFCWWWWFFTQTTYISTISQSKINNTKISFLKEKIWIPWRIRDFDSRTLNFTNLLYPIVFYYRGIYNETKKALDLTYTVVNYKLYNQTSITKFKDSYLIDIDLEKIFI